eukprot:m.58959 g.58959  ORF g.58959 m.58959 type:complete len:201 (-) comp7891_c2_seq1:1862-2464(-)
MAMILGELEESALSLLNTILATSVGAIRPLAKPSSDQDKLVYSTGEKETQQAVNSQSQRNNALPMIHAPDGIDEQDAAVLKDLDTMTEDELMAQIDRLNDDIRQIYIQQSREERFTDLVQDSHVISKAVWKDNNSKNDIEIVELVEARDEKSVEALQYSKACQYIIQNEYMLATAQLFFFVYVKRNLMIWIVRVNELGLI